MTIGEGIAVAGSVIGVFFALAVILRGWPGRRN
jgi:hypothetical protein